MANIISWFEIPAADIHRAATFYGNLFETHLQIQDFGGFKIATFPSGKNEVSGAVVQHEAYKPSYEGGLIYLNGGNDLSLMLAKVEASGGKIIKEKSMISPAMGYMALFEDTEGNRIALHSKN
jgi:uncharacterized protein